MFIGILFAEERPLAAALFSSYSQKQSRSISLPGVVGQFAGASRASGPPSRLDRRSEARSAIPSSEFSVTPSSQTLCVLRTVDANIAGTGVAEWTRSDTPMCDGKRVDTIDSRGVAAARACRVVSGVSTLGKPGVARGKG